MTEAPSDVSDEASSISDADSSSESDISEDSQVNAAHAGAGPRGAARGGVNGPALPVHPPEGGYGKAPLSIDAASLADDDDVPVRPPRPAIAIALALVSAGCLIAACFSHRWLANQRAGDFGYSLLSYQDCRSGCQAVSNLQVYENASQSPFYEQRISLAFPIAGAVAFGALLIAAIALLVAAAIAAADRRPDLPVFPTTIALLGVMIGLITGCVFVATKPGEAGSVGVAWSFWAFGLGAVTGLAGAQLLARQLRPADPDLLSDAMNPDQF